MAQYRTPTEEELQAARDYVVLRDEFANLLADKIDAALASAAERIATLCYLYNVNGTRLVFSDDFNKQLMQEISEVMDETEDEVYDLIIEYSMRAAQDNEDNSALLAWLVALGKGRRNLRDTLHNYLMKFLKDLEAAIAALRFMGTPMTEAIMRLRSYLHNIYNMPEVLTAIRAKNIFTAIMIQLGGVQKGAVGISNNGSTNVVNMGKTTLQMAWMRAQAEDFKRRGAIGFRVYRGSTYHCDWCQSFVGDHPIDDLEAYPPVHPHCMCYAVPLYSID